MASNSTIPVLERDASPELISLVAQVEAECDKWIESFSLSAFTHDVAVWGVMTQIIDMIEQEINRWGHGSQQQRETMINLGPVHTIAGPRR